MSNNNPLFLSVYLEDVIERTVVFIKYHLVHDIYPNYDPVYADPKGKGEIKISGKCVIAYFQYWQILESFQMLVN